MRHTPARISNGGTCYAVQGSGQWLVLIHGVGLDRTMWGGQVERLREHYRVLTYDMLGHGGSRNPSACPSLEEYAAQLRELADELGIIRAAVVGFSMGGLVARAFTVLHPARVAVLVVMNSVFRRNERQRLGVLARVRRVAREGPGANIEEALERWFSREYRAASPAQIHAFRERVLSTDPEGYLRTYSLFGIADSYMEDRLHEIRVPTLVMTGEEDVGSTPEMARELAEHIPGARICVLPGQRHMMPVEAPAAVNQCLLDFLRYRYTGAPDEGDRTMPKPRRRE